ncbi:MAG TPA: short chain dehydrogenase [Janthinobacterium sp.]|nr:short chain dehydrogenase [Janthinobacterium sp.]
MKAILTGHTRGLGAAIAAELLARHIPVLGLARARNTDLAGRFPAMLEECALDLADGAAVAGWLAGATLGRFLDSCGAVLLINNAGTVQPVGPLATQDGTAIARAVGLNIAAPLMLAGALAAAGGPALERRILHVSSGAARNAQAGWSVYGATKAALDQHARGVALDKTPGLRICSLAPGVIDTDMQAELRASSLERFPGRDRFDALKREGGLSDAASCARRLVDYLLSEQFGQAPVADLRQLD